MKPRVLCLLFGAILAAIPIFLTGQDFSEEGQRLERKWVHGMHFLSTAGQTSFEDTEIGFGMEYVASRQILPYLSVGAGAGLNMIGLVETRRFAPVFGELRLFPFTQARHQPFLVVDGGYAWAWKDANSIYRSVKGGMRLHAALGMQWQIRRRGVLFTDFGYIRQGSQTQRNNFWWWTQNLDENYIEETSRINRWVLRLGFGF
ncbi:MAG: hypothetical protein IPN74_04180 [Haliscomenobacter sp.]|nr:hypothetical protein [Haliscomenobacter sp.]MBK8877756.1 hypothetical protein [Haliscomenobacter sp.]